MTNTNFLNVAKTDGINPKFIRFPALEIIRRIFKEDLLVFALCANDIEKYSCIRSRTIL